MGSKLFCRFDSGYIYLQLRDSTQILTFRNAIFSQNTVLSLSVRIYFVDRCAKCLISESHFLNKSFSLRKRHKITSCGDLLKKFDDLDKRLKDELPKCRERI